MSLGHVTLAGVQVTAADVERVPVGNLRVPRAEFAAAWASAEEEHDRRVRQRVADWYGAGVVMACRWVAAATVRPAAGPWRLAESPVTGRTAQAHEESIEAELLAAEVLSLRQPVPAWLAGRPGWLEGVILTLQWCWRGSERPPLDLQAARSTG